MLFCLILSISFTSSLYALFVASVAFPSKWVRLLDRPPSQLTVPLLSSGIYLCILFWLSALLAPPTSAWAAIRRQERQSGTFEKVPSFLSLPLGFSIHSWLNLSGPSNCFQIRLDNHNFNHSHKNSHYSHNNFYYSRNNFSPDNFHYSCSCFWPHKLDSF